MVPVHAPAEASKACRSAATDASGYFFGVTPVVHQQQLPLAGCQMLPRRCAPRCRFPRRIRAARRNPRSRRSTSRLAAARPVASRRFAASMRVACSNSSSSRAALSSDDGSNSSSAWYHRPGDDKHVARRHDHEETAGTGRQEGAKLAHSRHDAQTTHPEKCDPQANQHRDAIDSEGARPSPQSTRRP